MSAVKKIIVYLPSSLGGGHYTLPFKNQTSVLQFKQEVFKKAKKQQEDPKQYVAAVPDLDPDSNDYTWLENDDEKLGQVFKGKLHGKGQHADHQSWRMNLFHKDQVGKVKEKRASMSGAPGSAVEDDNNNTDDDDNNNNDDKADEDKQRQEQLENREIEEKLAKEKKTQRGGRCSEKKKEIIEEQIRVQKQHQEEEEIKNKHQQELEKEKKEKLAKEKEEEDLRRKEEAKLKKLAEEQSARKEKERLDKLEREQQEKKGGGTKTTKVSRGTGSG